MCHVHQIQNLRARCMFTFVRWKYILSSFSIFRIRYLSFFSSFPHPWIGPTRLPHPWIFYLEAQNRPQVFVTSLSIVLCPLFPLFWPTPPVDFPPREGWQDAEVTATIHGWGGGLHGSRANSTHLKCKIILTICTSALRGHAKLKLLEGSESPVGERK